MENLKPSLGLWPLVYHSLGNSLTSVCFPPTDRARPEQWEAGCILTCIHACISQYTVKGQIFFYSEIWELVTRITKYAYLERESVSIVHYHFYDVAYFIMMYIKVYIRHIDLVLFLLLVILWLNQDWYHCCSCFIVCNFITLSVNIMCHYYYHYQ